jgi:hypothetical protein
MAMRRASSGDASLSTCSICSGMPACITSWPMPCMRPTVKAWSPLTCTFLASQPATAAVCRL